jgi:hypothetical protein
VDRNTLKMAYALGRIDEATARELQLISGGSNSKAEENS